MEFRPAVEADLPGEYEAFVAAQRELHDRHSVPWSATPFERWSTVHRHLLEHDGERSFVAEENGRIAGFSAAWVRDRTEAIQPVSTGLYARRGLIPATPVLILGGRPQVDAPAQLEPAAPGLLLLSPGIEPPQSLAISGFWLL